MGIRILKCMHCGNIIIFQEDAKVTPVCCGEKMTELKPGFEETYSDKHIPIMIIEQETRKVDNCSGTRNSKKGCCDSYVTVAVGSVQHPMEDEHYIQWILLETNCGVYTKYLESEDKPEAVFCLGRGEKAVKAYAYCNVHGLWVSK